MLTLFDGSISQLIAVDSISLLCIEFISVKLFSLNVAMAPWSDASTIAGVVLKEDINCLLLF